MGDRFSALLVTDGFAARSSRPKPLSALFYHKLLIVNVSEALYLRTMKHVSACNPDILFVFGVIGLLCKTNERNR